MWFCVRFHKTARFILFFIEKYMSLGKGEAEDWKQHMKWDKIWFNNGHPYRAGRSEILEKWENANDWMFSQNSGRRVSPSICRWISVPGCSVRIGGRRFRRLRICGIAHWNREHFVFRLKWQLFTVSWLISLVGLVHVVLALLVVQLLDNDCAATADEEQQKDCAKFANVLMMRIQLFIMATKIKLNMALKHKIKVQCDWGD